MSILNAIEDSLLYNDKNIAKIIYDYKLSMDLNLKICKLNNEFKNTIKHEIVTKNSSIITRPNKIVRYTHIKYKMFHDLSYIYCFVVKQYTYNLIGDILIWTIRK